MTTVGDRQHAELRRRYEALLDRVRNPARLTGGEPGAGSGFTVAPAGDAGGREVRVALGFPDTYEIGIANQAIQILYHLAGGMVGVGVERVYLPWKDVIAELRREDLPLVTLETWTPVRESHILGLSLQHELNFTNVLELLDLARIPLRSRDRREEDPLVIGGGPATANFTPMEPFFDAFVVGDAEESFVELLEEEGRSLAEGLTREGRRRRLAGIEGIYVTGVSRSVNRRVVPDLDSAPYPESCVVPVTAGVHDRGWVEVMRGCTRGCRFCQAGMWYRPVRERSPDEVLSRADRQLAASGYQELALASLSTTDYSGLGAVLTGLAESLPQAEVNLPSLRVDSAAVRLGNLTSPGGSSLTLAPEAGSQRMRNVVNKNVTEQDVLDAAGEAFALGNTTVKLYFMIGLPTEEDEDVQAIVELVKQVREVGRSVLGERKGRLQVHVSVTNFIPKPFTPFQWLPMAARETLERRQEVLRAGVRGKGTKLSLHDTDDSFLEASLARGGPELADVIQEAWRRGARFDSWGEEGDPTAWSAAFAATGRSAENRATSALAEDEPLPWESTAGVVQRDFLRCELGRALAGETTADCRSGACAACGACPGDLGATVGFGENLAEVESRLAGDPRRGPRETVPGDTEAVVHVLLTYTVSGRARYLGHLDTAEALRRAVRRAGGRLALSGGMRPKPLLAVALPRPVGVSGRLELCELSLAEHAPPDFARRLDEALPDGFGVVALEEAHRKFRAASRVRAATYRVSVDVEPVSEARPIPEPARLLDRAAQIYTQRKGVTVPREHKGKRRDIDVRAYVDSVAVTSGEDHRVLTFTARVTPRGTARPEEVVEAVAQLAEVSLEIRSIERTEILLEQGT